VAGNAKNKRKSAGTRKSLTLKTPVRPGSSIRETNIAIGVSKEATDHLKEIIYTCVQKLKARTMTTSEWNSLQFRLYFGAGLAKEHFNEEPYEATIEAINVLFNIQDRWVRTNIYAATDNEMDTLETTFDVIDGMQTLCTRREMLLLSQKVEKFLIKTNGNRITRNGILVAE
jgi:hypothetical protein